MTESTTFIGQSFDLAGAVHRIGLDGAASGGAATVAEVAIAPGAGVPPHSNARKDLVWHVLGGAWSFTCRRDQAHTQRLGRGVRRARRAPWCHADAAGRGVARCSLSFAGQARPRAGATR